MPEHLAFLDFDGTLAYTHHIYEKYISHAFAHARSFAGFNVDRALGIFPIFNQDYVERGVFDPSSIWCGIVDALEFASEKVLTLPQQDALYGICGNIFKSMPDLAPGAYEFLWYLRHNGFHSIVYTLGDPAVQRNRIRSLELIPLVDQVIVLQHKTAGELCRAWASASRQFGIPLERTWYVGDSLHHDILPAHQVGIGHIIQVDNRIDPTSWSGQLWSHSGSAGDQVRVPNLGGAQAYVAAHL